MKHLGPDAREGDLPDRRRRLAVFQLQRAFRQAEHAAAKRDRTGGDDENIGPAAMQIGEIADERGEPVAPHVLRVMVDEQRRADFYCDAAEGEKRLH